jgi:hypothetical protein
MLMKKYRFKNIHEKKISELNTYFEKHNAENTKDSILSEKTEKLRRLKEEQKKFNHVYDHMIALKKKLK